MHTIATHIEAVRRRAIQQAPIFISGLSRDEYLRRLAHVAAQWPTPAARTRTVDLRRPVAPPAWAPALVAAVQAALATSRTDVWGVP